MAPTPGIRPSRNARPGETPAPGAQGFDPADHGDAPAAVERLPGTALRGVSPRSELGRKVAAMSVSDIASRERAAFVREMAEGTAANRRAAVEAQAGETWDAAAEALTLSRPWARQ